MKKKTLVVLLCFISTLVLSAQESNQGKTLWAKSIINSPAPTLEVEKWLTEAPNIKGKFLLIDFWATWCGPCRRAIPELNKIAENFSSNLVVIGISAESEEAVRKMESPVMKYYSAIDTHKKMYTKLEITGIPHVILVDPNGIVRWEGFPGLSGYELTVPVVEDLIRKYSSIEKKK